MMEIEYVMDVNTDVVCRLCLSKKTDFLKSIFDEALSPNQLPLKINKLIEIQVSKNDKLSTMVCNDCIIRLDTWFSYKKQCHRNQTKLAEWLSKSTGHTVFDENIHIKTEPLDINPPRHGLLPVKMEYPVYGDLMDEEFNDFPHTLTSQTNDHIYLEDLEKEAQEADATSVKCPECGKGFGSVQNRKRHQNMVHRRDKRAQMMEIKKIQPEPPTQPQIEPPIQPQTEPPIQPQTEPPVQSQTEPPIQPQTEPLIQSQAEPPIQSQTEPPIQSQTEPPIQSQTEPPILPQLEQNSERITCSTIESTSTASVENLDDTMQNLNDSEKKTSNISDMDVTPEISNAEASKEDPEELPNQNCTENKLPKETSVEPNQEKTGENMEESKENQEESAETAEATAETNTEEKLLVNSESDQNEKPAETETDQQKIAFAAGLKLVQKDSTPIEFESLSKIELSYIEKCKAMVSMFHSLQCACHNVQHKSLRHLLSHLREIRVWFPLFTCYSCMISFTDRSTFTRHHCRCPKSQLETLIKLSNLRKRSEIKTRLYQNYKCNRCKFLYSFHEDFCKHINEDHGLGSPPIYCSCRSVFDSIEDYKTHCYTSCLLSYYCDICFITTATIDEFIKHCEEVHDTSEGFVLLQDDSYTPRNIVFRHKEVDEEANVIEGKRERRKSVKEPIMIQIYDKEIPPDPKDIPTKVLRQMIQLDFQPSTASEWNRKPTKCPVCKKEYSSVNNMIRHYRTHVERKEVELPSQFDESGNENEDLYSCPECGGMYPASRWKTHIEEKHPPISCGECDKVFQFQSELDQHRSVHLNLKVYRDSKTHSYKSAVISPGAETNGILGEVMVMCEICDTMFKSKEELKHHKLTCPDTMSRASSSMENFEMPIEDPVLETAMEVDDPLDCKGSVGSDSSLNEKLPCDTCGKIYSSSKSLREHVMNKHGLDFVKKSEFPKKCDYCDKVCSSGAGLALHTQVHERCNPEKKSEFPKKCEYCDRICTTGAGLYLHTQMHERMTLGDLKKDKPAIPIKPEIIKERKKSIEHQEDEEESYHTCKRCFKVFGTKGKLKDHMRSHGINPSKPGPKPGFKKRKMLCDLCHIAVDSGEALEKHKAEEHSDELDGMPTLTNELEVDEESMSVVYTCDVCVQTFDSKLELQQHKETHEKPAILPKTKTTLIYCKYCKIAFDSVNELTKHMHLEHGESAKPKITKEKLVSGENSDKPFKCPVCSKGFATHGAMTAHCGWHKRAANNLEALENTPQGTAAAKMVKKAKVLKKIHQATIKSEPIKPPEFQCTTCLMELPNDTALQIHVLEKHRSLDSLMLIPRCDTCNQDFVTQEEYETHKRFHDFLNRQKKHEEQLHAQQQALAQQQIQTPVIQSVQSVSESPQSSPKRHPCNWCNSVFSRSDTLNTHIRQNHKEHVKTEFECNQCDRVFDKQNSLTIHLKVHEKQKIANTGNATATGNGVSGGGKIYSCSICSQIFNFPKDLRMHTINAHPF